MLKDALKQGSPINYTNISYNILKRKGNKITREPNEVKGFVCKGTFEEIKRSEQIKRRLLKQYFGGKPDFKKIKEFELANVEIKSVFILKFLGYGIK
jgi:hypothetical protein